MILNISQLALNECQDILQHLIAPRPIALASTIDEEGNVNLSPFSFFNLFSTNPPVIIISPSRRVRNNTTKHTLDNIRVVPEMGISIVTYDIVQQTALASGDYPKGVDEFEKAGFTKKASMLIAPPVVGEAVASFECCVNEVKSLGEQGGAGQLVIAEILCVHIKDDIISDNKIDQQKIQHVARLGGEWYANISPQNLFRVTKAKEPGIGMDALPPAIRMSEILTGNHLAKLAGAGALPKRKNKFSDERLDAIFTYFGNSHDRLRRIHMYAKELIEEGRIEHAWQVLLHNRLTITGS